MNKFNDLHKPNKLLYGAAYYDEYMPYDRLHTDMQMMKKAGMNLIRIAESTWATEEPEDGVFDFSHVTRVLEAADEYGINVIVGTPTYAVPAWLYKKYPDILLTDDSGNKKPYGARQIMDITNRYYLFYAERIIRKLMEAVKDYKCVIGFQLDNETKHYGTSGENVQRLFVDYMKDKFSGNLHLLNYTYGLNYWSNRINSWEEFPSMIGTINGSLKCAYEEFRRGLVVDFLRFQRSVVEEYKREDQFITHNMDFSWRGYSFGMQDNVNHFDLSNVLDISGCDIYHPSQNKLTGLEIAMSGDIIRSLKQDNYFVLETEAQGFPQWTPYPGQLRLQAFSHLASGADCVEYWHWHSIHNSAETYWKGVLSHDFSENEVYKEACTIGADFSRLSDDLIHLEKNNKIAIMVDNNSLSALKCFPLDYTNPSDQDYNEVLVWMYKALYELNAECDFISEDEEELDRYDLIITPAMYCAGENTLTRLRDYVENGGTLFSTFKTAFADENVTVYHDTEPHILNEVFGIEYNEFTIAENCTIFGYPISGFMELVKPTTASVIDNYEHAEWSDYAAACENKYGNGKAYYLACKPSGDYLKCLLEKILSELELEFYPDTEVKIRKGVNIFGNTITYLFNYSGKEVEIASPISGKELLSGEKINLDEEIKIPKWGFKIIKN